MKKSIGEGCIRKRMQKEKMLKRVHKEKRAEGTGSVREKLHNE
jgi:hypothetical protein